MSTNTVEALQRSEYFLYAFGAVQASDTAGLPLVWQQVRGYAPTTVVTWSAAYKAFTSPASPPPAAGAVVAPGFSAAIALGQTLLVQEAGGIGVVTESGIAGALSIVSEITEPMTCGFSQACANGSFEPFCAFPLYGLAMETVFPLPVMLLLFSTVPSPPGTAVVESTGPGVLLDLGGATTRAVSFDIDEGWSWGQAVWGQEVPAASPLAEILVDTSVPPPAMYAYD